MRTSRVDSLYVQRYYESAPLSCLSVRHRYTPDREAAPDLSNSTKEALWKIIRGTEVRQSSQVTPPYEAPALRFPTCTALFRVLKPSQANLANDTSKYNPI
jgi:hypothetical protein